MAASLRATVEAAAAQLRALPGWPDCRADAGLAALADAVLSEAERMAQRRVADELAETAKRAAATRRECAAAWNDAAWAAEIVEQIAPRIAAIPDAAASDPKFLWQGWRRRSLCVAALRREVAPSVGNHASIAQLNALDAMLERDPRCRAAVERLRPIHEAAQDAERLAQQDRIREACIDPGQPDHLGWRVWVWRDGRLWSPNRRVPWPEDGILEAAVWSDEAALRGAAGIHARRLPRDWRTADWRCAQELRAYEDASLCIVCGLVERFGRAVVGTEGWRAERVVIRAVRAPDTATGLAIEQAYPTIEVIYPDDAAGKGEAQ